MSSDWRAVARYGLFGIAALLAPGLVSGQPAGLRDAALQRALQGVWCNSHDQGRSCWAWDEFFADGSFAACGRTEDDERPFAGRGRVSVEGQTMCYVVTAASENFWLRPGARYCTEIVAIDAQMHRYRDIDTGAEFTLLRRPVSEKRCP